MAPHRSPSAAALTRSRTDSLALLTSAARDGHPWRSFLTALAVIAGSTFVLGYYVPLHRAHVGLLEHARDLDSQLTSTTRALEARSTELDTVRAQHAALADAEADRERAARERRATLERRQAALLGAIRAARVESSAAVELQARSVRVAVDTRAVFPGPSTYVVPANAPLLCSLAKQLAVGERLSVSVVSEAPPGAPSAARSEALARAAARASNLGDVLQSQCGIDGARILMTSSLASPLETTTPPTPSTVSRMSVGDGRIELEFLGSGVTEAPRENR
jgi:hypothetical protein